LSINLLSRVKRNKPLSLKAPHDPVTLQPGIEHPQPDINKIVRPSIEWIGMMLVPCETSLDNRLEVSGDKDFSSPASTNGLIHPESARHEAIEFLRGVCLIQKPEEGLQRGDHLRRGVRVRSENHMAIPG